MADDDERYPASTAKPPAGEADVYGARTLTMKVDPELLALAKGIRIMGGKSGEETPHVSVVSETPTVDVDVEELSEDELSVGVEVSEEEREVDPIDDPDGWDAD